MAITLQTKLSLFPNMPIDKYNDGFGFGLENAVAVFRFTLNKIHPEDEVIIIPHFFKKEDIPEYRGKVDIQGNTIYIHVSMMDVAIANFYDVFIRKTSEESIRLFKEGEEKKNVTELDKLD